MKKILVFAGTTEGRLIARYLAKNEIPAHICVATEYGEALLEEQLDLSISGITISSERLNELQMEQILHDSDFEMVIDATHPYAYEVTENCKKACNSCSVPYFRVVREEKCETEKTEQDKQIIYVDSMQKAITYLNQTEGVILATTGSKDMESYLTLKNARNRVYFRVLASVEVLEKCKDLQIDGDHIYAMQGPFSEDFNYSMLREIHASYMVTKDSGIRGGFPEKIRAAEKALVTTIVIGRPREEKGYSLQEMMHYLDGLYKKKKRKIDLIGIGPGALEQLSMGAYTSIEKADILFGADRMIESVKNIGKKDAIREKIYQADKIVEYLDSHSEFFHVVVLYSGDVGFFSGAKEMVALLDTKEKYEYQCFPGISSMSYFMARIGKNWEDVLFTSIHGRISNYITKIRQNKRVVILLGNQESLALLCKNLIENHLQHVILTLGENLSYPNEEIVCAPPDKMAEVKFEGLALLYVENKKAGNEIVTQGIPDTEFVRDKIPMTKMEVRCISLAKLQLTKDAVCYDIGAGTGSVSIEMARRACDGVVYAVEENPLAIELLEKNKNKFGLYNIRIVQGRAKSVIQDLPAPTHVFIGGSKGELMDVILESRKKNPHVCIVINVIALESLANVLACVEQIPGIRAEYVQISVAHSKEAGKSHLMMGQNPVYVITLKETEE